MKNYTGLVLVLGAMILSGCAGAMPSAEEPVGITSTTSAELSQTQLASATAKATDTLPSWWAEDPWGPSVRTRPAPLPAEDPWSAAPPAPPAPVARTWGSGMAVEYGF